MTERRTQDQQPKHGIERRKDPRRRDLSRALGGYAIEFERERAERLNLEEKNRVLEAERYTDGLTGLANRRSFDEKFPELVDMAHSNNEPLALLFVDSNDLHTLNKQMGHTAGDELLKSIATSIKEMTRPVDLVTRIGGDEFAVVLTGFKPEADTSEVELIDDTIKRFKDALGTHATVGLAILQSDETAKELYGRADAACTANKPTSSRNERIAS